MLKTRVLTALGLLLFFIPVFLFTNYWVIATVISVLIALAAWEWGRFLWGSSNHSAIIYGLCLLVISLAVIVLPKWINLQKETAPILSMVLWLSMIFWLLFAPLMLRQKLQFSIQNNQLFLAISAYIFLLSAAYAFLVLYDKSAVLVLSVLLLVWTADIGAYFIGKQFGKHKLAPQISPGKSIEGALGAMFAVMLLSLCFYNYNTLSNDIFSLIANQFSLPGLILMSLFLTAMSIMGDLFESLLKRIAGVKDSSQLLPGHGGILDRLDALLPVLPICAILAMELS
jgi:phosphatidate cytidylyltransferase